jgi:hypothetical protein
MHDCPLQAGLFPPGRQCGLRQPQRLPSFVRSSGQSQEEWEGIDMARGMRSMAVGTGDGWTATLAAGALGLADGAGSPSRQAHPVRTSANTANAIRIMRQSHIEEWQSSRMEEALYHGRPHAAVDAMLWRHSAGDARKSPRGRACYRKGAP